MNGNVLGILAIIIAAAALVFSLAAFNRASEDRIGEIVEDKIEETLQGMLGEPSPQPQPEEPEPEPEPEPQPEEGEEEPGDTNGTQEEPF